MECENAIFFRQEVENITDTVQYTAKVTTECGYKRVHSLSIGDVFDDVSDMTAKRVQGHFKSLADLSICLLLGLLIYYFGLLCLH